MKKLYLLLAIIIASLNLRPIITSVAPLLGSLQSELGMSGLLASLLTTLPVFCMGIFAPAATKLRDRLGLERTIFFAVLLITLATAARGIIGSAAMLVISAFVGGVGISLAGPLLSGFIKKYFPTKPSLVSLYSAAMTVGAALASALSVPIFEGSGHSFTLALSCWSLLGVVALIVWAFFLREKGTRGNVVKTRLPLRNKRALLLTIFFGLMASMFYTVTAWISPIAHSFGYSKTGSAMMLTIFTIVQVPVSLIIPGLAAKTGRRRFFLITCSVFELAGVIMLLLHLPMLPAVICLGIGAGGLFPLALMLPIVETNSSEEAGSWSAMSQCGGYIIGAMGPMLVGVIYDHAGSFKAALLAMLVIVLVMIGVQTFITDRKPEAQVSS
ncbi:MFS transporter [Paenibacillus montaniterrae]|uniref:MFS transporter n=1 Tax=Paenibacillus montaniterrae TaxID=429341 RepID=A0A919YN03_9BACL|nr:MFS transporter [Paenibacillus montaniterrae]GIP16225.1 MFS transporter [Paenibacillus montaniterrae]